MYRIRTLQKRWWPEVYRVMRISHSWLCPLDGCRGIALFWAGELVGYSTWMIDDLLYIDELRIALLPEFRGIGLGTNLLEETIELMRHSRRIGIRAYLWEGEVYYANWLRGHGFTADMIPVDTAPYDNEDPIWRFTRLIHEEGKAVNVEKHDKIRPLSN